MRNGLILESAPPAASLVDEAWGLAVQGVSSREELVSLLGKTLARRLPGTPAYLLLPELEQRGWLLHALPEGPVESWPPEHPVPAALRKGGDRDWRFLSVPREGRSSPFQALPLRDCHGAILGAFLLAADSIDSEGAGAPARDWLREQSAAIALLLRGLRAEGELSKAQAQRGELEALKSAFLSAMSHELRTPLTSILGFSSLALDQPALATEPVLRNFIAAISDSAQRLERLISEILVMSDMTEAKLAIELRDHSFPTLMTEFKARCLPHLSEPQRIRLAPSPPAVTVRVDGQQFHRVLEHLLRNALKFSPPDSPVELSWGLIAGRRRLDATDFLRVSVRDCGNGVPEAERERIFERFYQIDRDDCRHHGGAGLGLAMAKEFTEAMGGRLWVEPAPERGAVFSFTLPVPRRAFDRPASGLSPEARERPEARR